jgi:hypothetical protein
MNTIYFKKRFYFLLLISIAVLEYFLVANIYSSKSDEKKSNTVDTAIKINEKSLINEKEPFDIIHSRLGENYVEDFLKYECLSKVRYGGTYHDLNYRIEGTYFRKLN